MNFNLNKFVEDVAQDNELCREFSKFEEMDEIYNYCKNVGIECSEDEFDESISEYIYSLDNNNYKIDDDNMSNIAGGINFTNSISKTLAVVLSALTLGAYFVGHFIESGVWEITDSPDGTTMAFLTLSMAEIFHSFNMRSQRGSLFSIKHMNKSLFFAGVASLICTTLVIYVPFLAAAFEFEHISVEEYLIALGMAFLVIPIVEIIKLIQRKCMASKQE